MDKKYLLKRMMKDCVPTMVSLLMSGLYSVMDGLFVGRAAGDMGLAALNIAWPIAAVITAVGVGIGSGGSVLYSNYSGKGEEKKSERAYHQTIVLLLAAGVVLLAGFGFGYPWILRAMGAEGEVYAKAAEYIQVVIGGCMFQILGTGFVPLLRNRGMAFWAMVSMLTGMVANGVLNYVLMFRVRMGVRGAAFGTIAAQGIVLAVSVYLIYGRQHIRPRFVWEREMIGKILKVGISAFGLSLAPSVVLLFTNLQCLAYGGEAAVACYAVISYIVFPVQSLLVGVGDGTQPLMSFCCGAGNDEELAFIRKTASAAVLLLGAALMGIVTACVPVIPELFGMTEESGIYFSVGMTISAASFLFTGLAKFHISYMNATLQVKKAMQLIYGESLLVSPLFLFLLPFFFQINGIWLSLPATQIGMLMIFNLFFTKRKG